MSDILQSGHHPDADQLSAFVEDALSPHERQQTLAHLALCPDCRSVVAFSLAPIETFEEATPEPVRRPWFFGWNMAWASAAGLVALVFLIAHSHNSAKTQNNTAAPSQVAASYPPSPLSAPATLPIPAPKPPLTDTSKPQLPHSHIMVPKKSPSPTPGEVIDGQSIASLPIQNRSVATLKEHPLASPTETANGSLHSSVGGSAAGVSTKANSFVAQAAAGNAVDRSQQNASRPAAVNLGSLPAYSAGVATPTMPLKQPQMASAPPPAAAGAPRNGPLSQNIQVNGPPVVTQSSRTTQPIFDRAKSALAQHPLPSQLPAMSVVSTGHQIVAIDTQNTLFFSDDDGAHWKTIPIQWKGRAVKVDLAASTQFNLRDPSDRTSKTNSLSAFGMIAGTAAPPSSSATLAGTVTDTSGAVISGASVVISNAATPSVRTVQTDKTGRYLVDGLTPGSYKIEAEAPGFTRQQLAVILTESQQRLADLTLTVGQATKTVTVDASAVAMEPSDLPRKKISRPLQGIPLLPLFEITTDTGEHWTSDDGQTWKPK